MEPTTWEYAYLAGLIDGDGSISIHKPGPIQYSVRVRVCGIDLNHLECLQAIFGGRLSKGGGGRQNQWGGNQLWQIAWNGHAAIDLLERLQEFLILKRGLAEVGIKFRSTLNLPGDSSPKDLFTRQEQELLHEVAAKLNRREV